MSITIVQAEVILRDPNHFASIVGFNINGFEQKISVSDEWVDTHLGRVPVDYSIAIMVLEFKLAVHLKAQLNDGVESENLVVI